MSTSKKEQKTEVQPDLPGIPQAVKQTFRVNYQYQGPNFALRAGSLIIQEETIERARIIANGTLKGQYGDKWFNVTKIVKLNDDEAPF